MDKDIDLREILCFHCPSKIIKNCECANYQTLASLLAEVEELKESKRLWSTEYVRKDKELTALRKGLSTGLLAGSSDTDIYIAKLNNKIKELEEENERLEKISDDLTKSNFRKNG